METSMCRCCASEGTFKDFRSSYEWMGEEEIYADMLQECFDVSLSTSELGDGGICEVCITQLRNASNFKKQVLKAEEQFLKHVQNKLFPSNIVKLEASGDEQDSNDDDNTSDWEPEFEVPIKAESPEEVKPKKRGAKSKETATTSSSKKPKTEAHASAVRRNRQEKRKSKAPSDTKASKKVKESQMDWTKHEHNIKQILVNTNATPIHGQTDLGFVCWYCKTAYKDPAILKFHCNSEHDKDHPITSFKTTVKTVNYCSKLDITDLTCNRCDLNINTLEQLLNHLQSHKIIIYRDIKNHIITFKFDGNKIVCSICLAMFDKFRKFQEHFHIHYRNYICDQCDAGYMNRCSLTQHQIQHKLGTFKCDFCPKSFDTFIKRRLHIRDVHSNKHASVCGLCGERFQCARRKDAHLEKVHGKERKIKCPACDKVFKTKNALTVHTKRGHLMERNHCCTYCEKAFFNAAMLKLHMVKHTGVKEFKCEVCHKSYGLMKTLKEHMKIHNDIRRFKCEHCGQAFVQKCSWKGHMKNRHGEIV